MGAASDLLDGTLNASHAREAARIRRSRLRLTVGTCSAHGCTDLAEHAMHRRPYCRDHLYRILLDDLTNRARRRRPDPQLASTTAPPG